MALKFETITMDIPADGLITVGDMREYFKQLGYDMVSFSACSDSTILSTLKESLRVMVNVQKEKAK